MKDIIDNFVKAHKDFKLYISYGRMDDIGLDCKTINTETYMISTIDRDFEFRANNEFNRTFFPECEHLILLGDNEYISTHNETDFKMIIFYSCLMWQLENLNFLETLIEQKF